MSENIEKIRTVAEYDGWVETTQKHVDYDYGFLYEKRRGNRQRNLTSFMKDIRYHDKIEWLYPVAGKVVEELFDIEIDKSGPEALELYTAWTEIEAANNTFDVPQLFEAVCEGIKIIDKFKKEMR